MWRPIKTTAINPKQKWHLQLAFNHHAPKLHKANKQQTTHTEMASGAKSDM